MIPKVLISTPTYSFHEYCLDIYAKHIHDINYQKFDVLLVDNSENYDYVKKIRRFGLCAIHVKRENKARPTMIKCRNIIRDIILNSNYEYLLFLDQDVFPPPDVLSRLIGHRKSVVSGVYTRWALSCRWAVAAISHWKPIRWLSHINKTVPNGMIPIEELPKNSLIPVYGTGHGCLLIAKQVLENIRFRYDPFYDNDSDIYFAADVHAAGFPFYLDTSVYCNHFSLVKDYVKWKKKNIW